MVGTVVFFLNFGKEFKPKEMNSDHYIIPADDSNWDDEFFLTSISRYNSLHMFFLYNEPTHLLPFNENTLYVVSKRSSGKSSEILQLSIPGKLGLPPEEEGLSEDNDFKIMSGVCTNGNVHQIGKISQDNKIITSKKGVKGLQIYPITDNVLGSKEEVVNLKVTDWPGPNFSVIDQTSQVICSKCHHERLVVIDINTCGEVADIFHPFRPQPYSTAMNDPCTYPTIQSKPLDCNTIAVLNSENGSVILHDLRSDSLVASFPSVAEGTNLKETWTFSCSDASENIHHYLGILSDRRSFYIYDKRDNSVFTRFLATDSSVSNLEILRLNFNKNQDKFSISGSDRFVEIFNLTDNNFEKVFTHDGHSSSNPQVGSVVTDHTWLSTRSREIVISICSDKSLHCWECRV